MNPVIWGLVVSLMGIIATLTGVILMLARPHSVSVRFFTACLMTLTACGHFLWSETFQQLIWVFIALTWWFVFFISIRTARMVQETDRSRKALDRATEITKEMDASFRRFNVRTMKGDISEESLSQFEKEMKELDAEGKAVFASLRPTDRLS